MSDQREYFLIVRPTNAPTNAPTKAELKRGAPDSQATVCLKDWTGRERWFHLELAQVWPLELDS